MNNQLRFYGELPPELELNKQGPFPGVRHSTTQTDSYGERFRDIVEFNRSDPASVAALFAKYPEAWQAFYDEVAPTPLVPVGASPEQVFEVGTKLYDAIHFWLYITEDETISLIRPPDPGQFSVIEPDNEQSFETQPRIAPYPPGQLENPNAFHDQEVFDRVTNNGADPLPLVDSNGWRIMSNVVAGSTVAGLLSAPQLGMTEYETTHNVFSSPYDYGGMYSASRWGLGR